MHAKHLLLTALLLLTACGGGPPPRSDPPRIKSALEAESDGARRYGRGDYLVAARRFEDALKLFASVDDVAGVERNRLHLVRTDLAQGRGESALQTLALVERNDASTHALEILLLKAQAQLAQAQPDSAWQSLAAATKHCGETCPQRPSLHLLQARTALVAKRPADALTDAEAALKLLQGKDEPGETGNAWRFVAAAKLASGDATGALPAAEAALDIDRRLAQPEKIANDWLLIGDIHKKLGAGDTARAAYQRALDVATAAGFKEAIATAQAALAQDTIKDGAKN